MSTKFKIQIQCDSANIHTRLKDLEGDWHEFESKALRKENERKAHEARKAVRQEEHQREKEKRRASLSGSTERDPKRLRPSLGQDMDMETT